MRVRAVVGVARGGSHVAHPSHPVRAGITPKLVQFHKKKKNQDDRGGSTRHREEGDNAKRTPTIMNVPKFLKPSMPVLSKCHILSV